MHRNICLKFCVVTINIYVILSFRVHLKNFVYIDFFTLSVTSTLQRFLHPRYMYVFTDIFRTLWLTIDRAGGRTNSTSMENRI
jgi:hypothetical protein